MKKFEKSVKGKNIVGSAQKELEPQMEKLFAILEQLYSNKLINGFSFQAGWSVYYLIEKENGNFILASPDISKNPFDDLTEDLTLALWVQLEQSYFLRKLNVDGLSIKYNDKIVLSKGVLDLKEIYLQRSTTDEKGDSGWFIGPVEGNHTEELYAIYAYQLLKLRQELIQVLALPNDYIAVFDGIEVKAVLNENDEDVWGGSALTLKNE